jgi:hypothetical protein
MVIVLTRRGIQGGNNGTGISILFQLRLVLGGSILLILWFSSSILQNDNPIFSDPVLGQDLGVRPSPIEVGDENKVSLQKTAAQPPASSHATNGKHKLRFDWTNLPVQSKIAKLMLSHQNNCSLPLGNHSWRKKIFGLGSDLHVWGAALCNGIDDGHRIRTTNLKPWVWIDQEKCDAETVDASTLRCYFPHAEMQCPEDVSNVPRVRFNISNPIHIKCDKTDSSPMKVFNKTDWRAAGVELLFSRVATIVQEEGERQLNLVFPNGVPNDLITVHMRWGDKKFENRMMNISNTMKAIEKIRTQRRDNLQGPASILLCTEDPKATEAFLEAAPKNWKIYIDQFYHEMLPFRPKDESMYNIVPKVSRSLNGKPGLWALGSLLVAMEADAFVLVLSSNWSRIMDELRRNVLNPRCQGCTYVVDVAEGKWKEW